MKGICELYVICGIFVESCTILVVVNCLSRPIVVLDGLPGLYGFKYDSAIACGLVLYLSSYKLDSFAIVLATFANFWLSLRSKLLMSSTRSLILRSFVAKLSLRLQRRSRRLSFLALREVMEEPLEGVSSSWLLSYCPMGLLIDRSFLNLLILRGAPEDSESFPDRADLLTGFLASLCMSALPYPHSGLRTPTMV